MILRKDELEVQLKDEHKLIEDGLLRDDSPLDLSPEFQKLCHACRVGDLKACQEAIASGASINASDVFDYTPLILASLCGHYEVIQLLLESGALCERDTFQGERCIYNALNNRIRNLLLQYDYSKSTDPLQPLASHITSLLTRVSPKTSDIRLTACSESWDLHKFILSARSPYFSKRLTAAPDTTAWKLSSAIPPEAFHVAFRYLYFGEVPSDLALSGKSFVSEEDVFRGIDKISKDLEIESLWEGILSGSDRRIARQRHQDEVTRGRDQIEKWFRGNVLMYRLTVDAIKAPEVKWTRDNAIFADVLLRADEDPLDDEESEQENSEERNDPVVYSGIPIGPAATSRSPSVSRTSKKSVLFPAHRAMLLRSEYFQTMFASQFQEAQPTEYLKMVTVDCSPAVLEIVLTFLYTENADIPIELAIEVLFAADMLLIEKLKNKAAIVISTVGNGSSGLGDRTHNESTGEPEAEPINVYDVIRAGWDLKVQRLEEFSARYLAYRLEDYIDEEDFEELIKESASRIEKRQETDTIELLDDIRYYLSERFRLRFEDTGLETTMDQAGKASAEATLTVPDSADVKNGIINMDTPQTTTPVVPGNLSDPSLNPIETLDGKMADDEFVADAINYQVLLRKIDDLLERLKLDA